MKKILKKDSLEFVKKARNLVISLGAKEEVDYILPNKFNLDTVAGDLSIRIDEDNKSCFTVYTKFADVSIAKKKISEINRFSGKWNFYLVEKNIDVAINILKYNFLSILK